MSKAQGQRHVNLKSYDGPDGLLVGVIRQALDDIRHPPPATRATSATPTLQGQLEAIEWLLDGTQIREFAALIGLDPTWLVHELQIAAGLVDGTPRLGQRRPHATRQAAPDATTIQRPRGRTL